MFDFCFKRLFSFCRELCSSGQGQRRGQAGGSGRAVYWGPRPSWGMPRVALGAASAWGQVESAGNTPFPPAAGATCPEPLQTTQWTGGRGLSLTASRRVGGVEAAEPPRPARSAFESVFVQVLSAGKNVPGPPTWGRDRAGQRRVQPGGLAQGKAGAGPRGLSGSLQSPGGALVRVCAAPPGS